jgi:hypothetical protein
MGILELSYTFISVVRKVWFIVLETPLESSKCIQRGIHNDSAAASTTSEAECRMASPNFLTASMLLRVVLVEKGISFCTLEAQKRLWVRVLLLIEHPRL